MRRALVTIVVVWFLLIGIFVEISPFQSPWPQQRYVLDGAEFAALAGGQIDGSGLAITTPDENYGALLVRGVEIADAAQWPVLRYHIDSLAPSLEVAFVYRRADSPGDVRTVNLTRGRGATGSIDLSRENDWRGAISEIGFAIYPVTQSVPPEQAFRPFVLRGAEFWSPSWVGRGATVATEWSGRRAWSLMSISALGPDNGVVRARSPVLLLTLGLGFTLLLLTQFTPTTRSRNARVIFVAVATAWLMLDLRWSRSFADRHAATRQIYAPLDWPQRQQQLADADVLAAAQSVRQALRDDGVDPDRVRLLVDAKSDFLRARFIYHLAPARTGPVNLTGWRAATAETGPIYLATFEQPEPLFDAADSRLRLEGDFSVPARQLADAPPLRLYRIGPESPP
jgi:hypothetical protein